MFRLYDNLSSGNGYKVRLLMTQLEIQFQRIELDIFSGESRTPEFLAKNPNGRIPALELEDGTVLAESNAILFYLAEGTPFLSNDRLGRARTLQWMFFEQYSHEPYVAVPRAMVLHPPEGGLTDAQRTDLEARRKRGHDALAVMERHLAGHAFMAGERYSIADIALYAYTHVAPEGGIALDGYPAIGDWLGRVADQPGYIPITQG